MTLNDLEPQKQGVLVNFSQFQALTHFKSEVFGNHWR